jgi:hypothetical protein
MLTDMKRHYLSELEFCVLMTAGGRKIWYGPNSGGEEMIASTEDLNRIMADLYQKGYLDWEGSRAVIADSVAPVFRGLQNAEHCILTGRAAPNEEITYYYLSPEEEVVQLTVSPRQKRTICLMKISRQDWVRWLEDADFFPEMCVDNPEFLSLDTEEVHSFMELHSASDGELLEQVLVVDEGPYGILVLRREGREQHCLCTPEEYTAILNSWMERGRV